MPPKKETPTVLQEAQNIIYGDRQEAYGSATDNFERTTAGWNAILSKKLNDKITPEDVGLMMIWLKVSCEVNKPTRDNLIDICGYAGCIEKVKKGL